MITPKFNYTKISRVNIDGKRHYLTPDNEKVASVTTILDQTKSKESVQALYNWRNRVGHKRAAEITVEAAGRGTRMHKFLENHVEHDDFGTPGTNPYSIQSYNMARHVYDSDLKNVTEFYGSEVSLYYPSLYAGTTDLSALYKDNLTIIDFKQTNKPKKEEWVEDYKCQIIAYIFAHNEIYKTDINHGIIMMCSPDLTFQKFEINPNNFNEYEDKWWTKVAEFYKV